MIRAVAACLLLVFPVWCGAEEVLHWQRLPLRVALIVGQERVILVDRNVRIGLPSALTEGLRAQSAGGAVYLLADAPLPPSRVELQDVDTGSVILLDVSAEAAKQGQAALQPLRIVSSSSGTAAPVDGGKSAPPASPATPLPVVLTRYAAQSLYAPLRTIDPVPGIVPVSLAGALPLETLLPTLPVRAEGMAAWRLADLWVSAVRLTNNSAQPVALDPRALQGDFVAATFQHPDLGPAGAPSDTTVVYLVTRGRGLAQSLLPSIRSFDATANIAPSDTAGRPSGRADAK
nr:TIGR03749 family integrating conjugative element protein [uncultured Caldimonas sp.]